VVGWLTASEASLPTRDTLYGRSVISHLSFLVTLFLFYRTRTILQYLEWSSEHCIRSPEHPQEIPLQVKTESPAGESFFYACDNAGKRA